MIRAVAAAAVGTLAVVTVVGLISASSAARRVRQRLALPAAATARLTGADHRGWLATRLQRADLAIAPAEATRLWCSTVLVVALLGLLLAGPVAAAVAALAVAPAGPIGLVSLGGRRDRRADAGLPAVLDDVARALRAGAAPTTALDQAATGTGPGAARAELRAVVHDVHTGLGLVEALERWADRRPTGPVRLAVGALAIGASTGGARSRAVEAVAATLRERQAVEREASALATQARSSAVVIALAPLAFAALAGLSDPAAGAFLVGSPVGLACLTGGLALDGLGAWWMRRIVRPG